MDNDKLLIGLKRSVFLFAIIGTIIINFKYYDYDEYSEFFDFAVVSIISFIGCFILGKIIVWVIKGFLKGK